MLKDVAFTYAYGNDGVPHRMYDIGRFELDRIPLGLCGHIDLSDVKGFTHPLLGVDAFTGTACATVRLVMAQDIPLGRLILDYRGSMYTDYLGTR
jgi:hypothetical protein